MTTQLDVLVDMRDKIAKGWTRGTEHKVVAGNDHFCLLGAHSAAPGSAAVKAAALQRINEALPDGRWNDYNPVHFPYNAPQSAVWRFNDRQKDKRPVLRMLDKAIALAKARVR